MAAFDGRMFSGGTFDIGTIAPVSKVLGGWTANAVPQSTWAPGDLARGTQWSNKPKGQATW